MSVITRFAPSPTGYLHIGGARTALFNWLYARANGGKFLLRIEDTDRERSTHEAVDAIIDGLSWLGLDWDEEPIFQASRSERHREVALSLIEKGHAFKCYVTPDELSSRRELGQAKRIAAKEAEQAGNSDEAASLRKTADELLAPFRSPYRDGAAPPSSDAPYVVRLRAPSEDERVGFNDGVQGEVSVTASSIDDLVLLRSDGSPTYMLAVVVDDHDMGVTQVIRGDDHLANTYRQLPIYQGMNWTPPSFAHVPLIHGQDGKKLSKRHGALGVEAYRDLGFLPEGVRNYLLRLGWSHGDEEIIPDDKAIEWFDVKGLNKAPSRLDLDKLSFINSHYLSIADNTKLLEALKKRPEVANQSSSVIDRVKSALPMLKTRAATLVELEKQCAFLFDLRPIEITGKLRKKMDQESLLRLQRLKDQLVGLEAWNDAAIGDAISSFCATENIGMGQIGPTLRASLTGGLPSPDLSLILEWLGKTEALNRIEDQLSLIE